MSLNFVIARQWDEFRRNRKEKKIKKILSRPYFSSLSFDEKSYLKFRLSDDRFYKPFLKENRFSSFTFPSSLDFDVVTKFNATGYCANNLSWNTIYTVRLSMDMYKRTNDSRYFVRRFHRDLLSTEICDDIVSYYSKKRHLTLDQISGVLSEKYGIKIPRYQISRVARRVLPRDMWRWKRRIN